MKHTYSALIRLLALVLVFALVLPLSPAVRAAGRVYYPIDFTEEVLASRITQRVSGGCAVASMATIESYLFGAATDEEKEIVYNAVISANGDDDYAYWGNVGYRTSQDSIDWEAVYNQIAQGYPCIIHRPAAGSSPQHWSVVAGYQGSSATLEPDQFLVVEVNQQAGASIQTVAEWRGSASVDRYTWRGTGMTITELSGIRFAINHPPVVKLSGASHSVGGTIVSDVKLTRILVKVTCLSSGKNVYSKTLTPNAQSYRMSGLDSEMTYSSWGIGSYYLTIHVTDANNREAMYGYYFEIASDYPAQKPDPAYAFAFDPGTGSGSMYDLTLYLGEGFTLPACTMSHTGGSFTGWHVLRDDGTWLVDGMQWLTDSDIAAGGHSKTLLPDKFQGTLDAWWIRDALTLCGYTLVAQWTSDGQEPSDPPAGADICRIYGDSRYQTAFAVADALKDALGVDSFDHIVIASGLDFADALSGSYLASEKNAPILMTNGRNSGELTAWIQQNWSGRGTVYILGGTAAVPEEIPDALLEAGIQSTRLYGNTRFETNLKVLEEAGVGDREILIASGHDFADALAASATGLPILLVNSTTGQLTKNQTAFLRAHSDNTYTIIGGEAAVPSELEIALQELDLLGRDVGRVYGTGREETSVRVAGQYFDSPDQILLAFSRNFPDGLCGGPLAHALGAPLILVNEGREKPAAEYVAGHSITKCTILGGTAAVSESSVRIIFP